MKIYQTPPAQTVVLVSYYALFRAHLSLKNKHNQKHTVFFMYFMYFSERAEFQSSASKW